MSAESSPSLRFESASWKDSSWYKVLPLRCSRLVCDLPPETTLFCGVTGDVAWKKNTIYTIPENMSRGNKIITHNGGWYNVELFHCRNLIKNFSHFYFFYTSEACKIKTCYGQTYHLRNNVLVHTTKGGTISNHIYWLPP